MSEDHDQDERTARIDRLLDAIELVKLNRRRDAREILRQLIREDSNFEDAWLWMAVAVDSIDQSTVCLDNVLRVNPDNIQAAGALYRLRETEIRMEKHRSRLTMYRDTAIILMWLLTIGLLYAILFTFMA